MSTEGHLKRFVNFWMMGLTQTLISLHSGCVFHFLSETAESNMFQLLKTQSKTEQEPRQESLSLKV